MRAERFGGSVPTFEEETRLDVRAMATHRLGVHSDRQTNAAAVGDSHRRLTEAAASLGMGRVPEGDRVLYCLG